MATLSEAGQARLRELVAERLDQLPASLQPSDFLDNLILRAFRRFPPMRNQDGEDLNLDELEGGEEAATAFICQALRAACESPYFMLVQQIAISNDDQAFQQLMGLLDRNLRLKGILYRHGLDPEREYPGVWGKIWEAIPKWDGR